MTAEDAIYHAEGYADDDLNEADIVEWYEARPVTVPTAVATGAIVADMLFAIARQRNATLVVVTHDAEIAKRADRIVEMSDGRVV